MSGSSWGVSALNESNSILFPSDLHSENILLSFFLILMTMTSFHNLLALPHPARCQLSPNLQCAVACWYVCKCEHPASSQVKIGALFILLGPVILTKKQQKKSRRRARERSRGGGREGGGRRRKTQQRVTPVTFLHQRGTHTLQISTTCPACLPAGYYATLIFPFFIFSLTYFCCII